MTSQNITLVDTVKAELIKTKRTYNLLIMCVLPALCTMAVSWYFIKYQAVQGAEAWNMFITRVATMFYLMYPLMIAVIAYSISQIEYKNNTFKQFYTFPVSRFMLYVSKVIVLALWITASLLTAFVLVWLGGHFVSLFSEKLAFGSFVSANLLAVLLVRYFFTLMALASIHFLISIYWNKLILSLGSAIFLSIIGSFVAFSESGAAFPYSNLLRSNLLFTMKQSTVVFDAATLWCAGYTLLFFALGYLLMGRKQIK